MLTLIDPTNFRMAIVCATLTERPLVIDGIRQAEKDSQGIAEYEMKFLELIGRISNGAKFEISKTGKNLKYYPGIITNNDDIEIEFDCGTERSITYFLEPLIPLALYGKSNLKLTLRGVTNDETDVSIDTLINCTIPLVKKFGIEGDLSAKVTKRGFRPLGGGEVKFRCPFVKFLKAVNIIDAGKIKRIRGVGYASRVSAQVINRMVNSCREIFNDYIPDVWIYSDYHKGAKSSLNSGYGISLIAETNTGALLSSDEVYDLSKGVKENLPEKLGEIVSLRLLDEILFSGYVDSSSQSLILLLMALSEKNISKVKLGRLTSYSIETMRLIRNFFGVTFKINSVAKVSTKEVPEMEEEKSEVSEEETNETQGMIFSCVGMELSNIARILK